MESLSQNSLERDSEKDKDKEHSIGDKWVKMVPGTLEQYGCPAEFEVANVQHQRNKISNTVVLPVDTIQKMKSRVVIHQAERLANAHEAWVLEVNLVLTIRKSLKGKNEQYHKCSFTQNISSKEADSVTWLCDLSEVKAAEILNFPSYFSDYLSVQYQLDFSLKDPDTGTVYFKNTIWPYLLSQAYLRMDRSSEPDFPIPCLQYCFPPSQKTTQPPTHSHPQIPPLPNNNQQQNQNQKQKHLLEIDKNILQRTQSLQGEIKLASAIETIPNMYVDLVKNEALKIGNSHPKVRTVLESFEVFTPKRKDGLFLFDLRRLNVKPTVLPKEGLEVSYQLCVRWESVSSSPSRVLGCFGRGQEANGGTFEIPIFVTYQSPNDLTHVPTSTPIPHPIQLQQRITITYE